MRFKYLPQDQPDLLQRLRRHAGRPQVRHEPADVDLVDLADRRVAEHRDDMDSQLALVVTPGDRPQVDDGTQVLVRPVPECSPAETRIDPVATSNVGLGLPRPLNGRGLGRERLRVHGATADRDTGPPTDRSAYPDRCQRSSSGSGCLPGGRLAPLRAITAELLRRAVQNRSSPESGGYERRPAVGQAGGKPTA